MAAGIVLAHFGAGLCFLANATSFMAVLAALVVMETRDQPRTRTKERARFWHEFLEAARYARSERGIWVGMLTNAAMVTVASPIIQGGLISIVALKAFHVGAAAYGLLAGALGLGAIIGALIVGRSDGRIAPSRMVTIALAFFAAMVALLGAAPHLAVGLVAMVGLGAGYLMVVSSTSSSIQLLCDDRLRGRVMALWLTTFGAVFPPSVLIQGALADAIGIRAVVLIDAGVIALFGVFVASRGLLATLDPPDWRGERAPLRQVEEATEGA
jgi:MFS family permease